MEGDSVVRIRDDDSGVNVCRLMSAPHARDCSDQCHLPAHSPLISLMSPPQHPFIQDPRPPGSPHCAEAEDLSGSLAIGRTGSPFNAILCRRHRATSWPADKHCGRVGCRLSGDTLSLPQARGFAIAQPDICVSECLQSQVAHHHYRHASYNTLPYSAREPIGGRRDSLLALIAAPSLSHQTARSLIDATPPSISGHFQYSPFTLGSSCRLGLHSPRPASADGTLGFWRLDLALRILQSTLFSSP